MSRFVRALVGLFVATFSFVVAYWVYVFGSNDFSNVITVGAPQTQISISTTSPLFSMLIFAFGATFSVGVSLIASAVFPGNN